eukprot:c18536_g1_i1.p1 GENE.c18536_g1_i1~~c18536_g1_i1.p1  ORF type:complete len:167 (-),score=54.17 c18536_g1_i1:230-730(-)
MSLQTHIFSMKQHPHCVGHMSAIFRPNEYSKPQALRSPVPNKPAAASWSQESPNPPTHEFVALEGDDVGEGSGCGEGKGSFDGTVTGEGGREIDCDGPEDSDGNGNGNELVETDALADSDSDCEGEGEGEAVGSALEDIDGVVDGVGDVDGEPRGLFGSGHDDATW